MQERGAHHDARAALAAALSAVAREGYLPEAFGAGAPRSLALPIGEGEVTLPQDVIEKMFTLADIRPGDHVLIAGAGYGYAPALAAALTGREGVVVAYERNAAICEEARRRMAAAGISGAGIIRLICGNALEPDGEGKDDAILVFGELPGTSDAALIERMAFGARMVYGAKGRLVLAQRTRRGDVVRHDHGPFAFAPLRP